MHPNSTRKPRVLTLARPNSNSLGLKLAFLVILTALALGGCNTVSGVGEDISAAGKGLDQTSERTQEKLTGKDHSQDTSGYKAGAY